MNKGMTLVEATISVALSGILTLTVVVALNAGAGFTSKAATLTQMRRDVRYALRHIEKQVRPCKSSETTASGDTLTLTPGGASKSYQKTGSTLTYTNGGTTVTLIGSGVSSLSFSKDPGGNPNAYVVTVNLTLAQGAQQVPMTTKIGLRNK